MEGLRELEQAQKMLSLIQANNLSSKDHESERFLADFLLFMVKSCGSLDTETKYNLISENLPKISPAFLEEAMTCVDVQDQIMNAQPPTGVSFSDRSHLVSVATSMPMAGSEDVPMVGLDSLQRANSTLEDFCRSYFMFHGMDVQRPEAVFKYLPILSFIEGYIYQLDTLNEEILCISQNIDSGSISKAEKSRKLADDVVEVFESGAFRPLIVLLEHHSLLTNRIREELSCGEEYWALERKLCRALISRKEILIEDVMKAIHLKSFDYRVLNLLLYQLQKSQVNEMHMEFLSISEFLVEISDDLFDYEEDVIENNFNVLRMFVGVYGASVAPVMLAKCITEAEEKYENLLKALDPELSVNYRRRCEEATKEGGSRVGTSLGTWSIPPVIGDEEFYRSECMSPGLKVSNSV